MTPWSIRPTTTRTGASPRSHRSARLGGGRSLDEFVAIMRALDLPYPKFIDYAVPGNRRCGVCPEDLPDDLKQYCDDMRHSPQG